ncbi:MAG: nuclear transport factor 2 family protein [Jatrophihabitans sp.]|uniref:nuclear transport factor 2 family protein n=1 Tax=Jatrophihabitans sp. TaxID=1932789 RepID=UPI003F813B7A
MSAPPTPSSTASRIDWKAPSRAPHPARDAALRSYEAVIAKDKQAWLDNFADDGWIEDPVGPSIFDPEGNGHHGPEGRAAFWDLTIATIDTLVFEITDSFAVADECANVGTIHTTLANGWRAHTTGVFLYKVDAAGKIVSLRAFWEFDRTMASSEAPPA